MKKLLLVVVAFIVTLIFITLFERGVRNHLNSSGYFKAMIPNLHIHYDTLEFTTDSVTSSQGLRNNEVSLSKNSNMTRILALGDSFTFGWGVDLEKTWPKILENNISKKKQIEVINAGVPGAGITTETEVCQAYKNRFKIDQIILQVFVDDLYQEASRAQSISFSEKIISHYWPVFLRLNKPIIRKDNISSNYIVTSKEWKKDVKYIFDTNKASFLNLSPRIRSHFLEGKINPSWLSRSSTDPGYLTFVLDKNSYDYSLNALAERLQVMKSTCSGNTPVAVIFLPDASFVNKMYLKYKKELGLEIDKRTLTFDIDTDLRKTVEKNGFSYYSVVPVFRKNGCEKCYHPYDGHLTEYGQELVAKYLTPLYK